MTLPIDSEHYLFLKLTTMTLTITGVILVFRQKQSPLRLYVWTGVLILVFAFGPMLHYSTPSGSPYSYTPSRFLSEAPLPAIPPNIPMPWIVAYFVLPGFAGLRVPARLIGLLLIMLALLSAYAIAWFQNRVGTRFIASNAIIRREKIQATEQTARRVWNRFIASHIFKKIAIQCLLIF